MEEAVRKENGSTNTESEATVSILDLEVQDIEGAGPTTAKPREAGIVSVRIWP
ncbi:MAG: hypothetical protein WBE34_02810 [Candidatus Nitrosopolaris sp.]